METIITPDILLALVGGAGITLLGKVLRTYFKTARQIQFVVILVAIILGAVYYTINTFFPSEFKVAALNFIYGTLTSAVFIYEFIWKNLFSKKEEDKTKKERPPRKNR